MLKKSLESHTFLGFDYGTKSLGIAVGQTITHTAQPLTAIRMQDGKPAWVQIDDLIQEWQPQGFVVGLAFQPDGTDSKTSLCAKDFGELLRLRYNCPVHYIDERLTSVAARAALKSGARAKMSQKAAIDCLSAAIILESWLNDLKINMPSVKELSAD